MGGIMQSLKETTESNEIVKRRDGDFQCKDDTIGDFWTNTKTVESMVKMIIDVQDRKKANPRTKIFFHDGDSKIEIKPHTKPSDIIKDEKSEYADLYFDNLMQKHKEKQQSSGAAR